MKMNFINHLTPTKNTTKNIQSKQMPMRSDRMRLKSIINIPIVSNSPIKKVDDIGKVAWGPPTWMMFHTMAEKIDERFFAQNSLNILQLIQTICHNLPCELCSNHAKQYMNKVQFNTIRTKDDLKRFLFDFHNDVNKRKGYPLFEISQLQTEYINRDMKQCVYDFIVHFQKKTRNIHLISQEMYRQRNAHNVREWFRQNIQHFS